MSVGAAEALPVRRLRGRGGRDLDLGILGFGGAPLGNYPRAIDDATAAATLDAAWDGGVRFFDTAPQYGLGLGERRMGAFLARRPRGQFVLSTKVGRLLVPCAPDERDARHFVDVPPCRIVYDYGYDGVMRSLEASRARLGIDRFDIVHCHDIDAGTDGTGPVIDERIGSFLDGGWRALEALRAAGDIAAVGAGLNSWQVCQRLADLADFDLFLLAGRYTLLEQGALASFLPLCAARGIAVVVGGPFNSGILATGVTAAARYDYRAPPAEVIARVATIERICRAHGVAMAAAALQFPLAHPAVVSVLAGAQAPAEVAGNLALLRVPIPAALWSDLKAAGLMRRDAPC
ncbi:MAG: aldo/keto reductase [Alphaproteobacteria bacterium]|nr:aldo/keto reductase [Alphaproteobacteria bacterium]